VLVSHEHRVKIEDLKTQIDLISDQLSRKDEQITQLNEVTQKQAVHIQSLIQENSKLNMKLLPEITEKKTLVEIMVIVQYVL
jgi:regulator of replication initiation timing